VQKNNLLSDIIKENYENYYINSGVNLLLLERSFIDDAIDKITAGAKSAGKGLTNKAYAKVRSLAPTKKGKRLRISNKYQKEFNKNTKEIEDLSYDLAELEDNLDDMDTDSFEFKRTEKKFNSIKTRMKELGDRNSKLSKFIISQPIIFDAGESKGKGTAEYAPTKSDPILKKLRDHYLNITLKHSTALAKLSPNHNTVKYLENEKKKAEQKLYDRGYPRMDENVEYENNSNYLLEGWRERFEFNVKNYASSFKDSLSKGGTIPRNDDNKNNYDDIFSALKNQKNLMPEFNNKNLRTIGESILKSKNETKRFNTAKEVYNELENFQKNILSQKRISLDNIKLNPAALFQMHVMYYHYAISLSSLAELVKKDPDLILAVGEFSNVLDTRSKSIVSKENLLSLIQEMYSLYHFLMDKNKLKYDDFSASIKKYNKDIVKLYNYIHGSTHEKLEEISETQKHIEIKPEPKKIENKSENLPVTTSKAIDSKRLTAMMSQFSDKKRKKIVDLLNNFVTSVGEDDPSIGKKVEKFVSSSEQLFKNMEIKEDVNLGEGSSLSEKKLFQEIVEGFAHVRWRRNPRTKLDKIVMTCKSDEYKKPLNREISVAGKKVKEVMCLPKSTKPAKQKEKDRKSSLKRWRKIKSNPGKMRRMFVKRKMTKARSKTLR